MMYLSSIQCITQFRCAEGLHFSALVLLSVLSVKKNSENVGPLRSCYKVYSVV